MKITRRTKLLVVALALCFTTMIGSTVAWFTDTVEVTGNKIEAGTLKLEVLYQDDNNAWNDLEQKTDPLFSYDKWEPGYAVVQGIEIKNTGTLALKYKVNFELTAESTGDYKLEDVIDVYLFDQEPARSDFAASAKVGTLTDLLYKEDVDGTVHGKLAGGATTGNLYIGLKMREEADNNYQGLSVGNGFNLVVVATQDTVEADSFDEKYDEDALYPGEAAVSNVDELKKALENGDKAVLTDDIELTSTLMTKKDAVIDLNGKTITAPSSGAMFQSQSNAAPDIEITSSKAGAKINVTGGDTSVLLGYGSTVINNVTIDVTGCDNYSPNPFNVYGNLTLGEGTVVNIDYLGTALISNNGKVAIVIDGADINIGTFKTNGTAIITLNQASTLEMKNTTVKIDKFVLSPFGGDSLVSKIDGVKIESCDFDVTDSNGDSCTFVAKDGKYRLVQK